MKDVERREVLGGLIVSLNGGQFINHGSPSLGAVQRNL